MIAWFDVFSGISGDMTLGAFVDLGVPVDYLKKELALLPLKDFDIKFEYILRNGIKAVNLFVDTEENKNVHENKNPCKNKYSHANKTLNKKANACQNKSLHDHEHLNENKSLHKDTQAKNTFAKKIQTKKKQAKNTHVRNYNDIKSMISNSLLPERVKLLSLTAFQKIATAESKIHGLDIENIHFHEVGAIDSIVDIVGSFLCVDFLGITKVYSSPIPLGTGFVKCSHGTLPVPVPAVMAILKGIPVKDSGIKMEIVTPTGAAIIATLASGFGPMPDMLVKAIGYGSGKKSTNADVPNLLRIVTGTKYNYSAPRQNKTKQINGKNIQNKDYGDNKKDKQNKDNKKNKQDKEIIIEKIFVLETSIDDMNPEISGYIMEKLFKNGALDVYHIPVYMKKNRPGTKLEVLCKKDRLDNIVNIIMEQSTTIGVRYKEVERAYLKRKKIFINTSFGIIQAKQITSPGGKNRIAPEYEACYEIAEKNNIPLRDVYAQVYLDMNQSKFI